MRLRKTLPWVAGIAVLAGFGALYYERCGPFPDWQSSSYVLPYAVGSTYFVSQSSCTNGGHRSPYYKYSYDFAMPIGTTVTAAREGVVVDMRTNFRDGQRGEDESNWV